MSRPSRISPARAACSSRAATLTVSPAVNEPRSCRAGHRLAGVDADAHREVDARARGAARRATPRPPRASRPPPAPPAARRPRARPGSPNTAMTASPMNFSTVPPWRSIDLTHATEPTLHRPPQRLGSTRSPSAVDPTTSAKITVTTCAARPPRPAPPGPALRTPGRTGSAPAPARHSAGTSPRRKSRAGARPTPEGVCSLNPRQRRPSLSGIRAKGAATG